jgi:ethanolamine utilization protein EutQ (cupin superfamily)
MQTTVHETFTTPEGRLAFRMDDGYEFIAGRGDVMSLPSGHEARVAGDEPVVVVGWFGASKYTR